MKKSTINILIIVIIATLIRVVALDKFPAGLNADEAAIGYNAWSLLETGKDEHSTSWPLVFRSFDDYKPPMYFYLVLPFVKFLGLNIWAVRLPSAILGIVSVYLIYLLIKELFPKEKHLPLISSLLLALSPWHIHFSRGGWEVNAALFFILLSLIFFMKSGRSKSFISNNFSKFSNFSVTLGQKTAFILNMVCISARMEKNSQQEKAKRFLWKILLKKRKSLQSGK